jgi:hypothetical protein
MTNEEIQRTMEFILQGQARFDARMEKDEARITRLEDAFVTLVEIARITDERQDKTDQRVDALARLEDAFVTLVEIARITDERQDKTDQRVDTFDEKLSALIDVVERYITKGNNGTPRL